MRIYTNIVQLVDSPDERVLVIYERGKDSFLPATRTYKFPRVQKDAVIGKDATQRRAYRHLLAVVDWHQGASNRIPCLCDRQRERIGGISAGRL